MSDINTVRSSGVLSVELNRPAKKNAITAAMSAQFREDSDARRGRIGPCPCQ